VSCKSCELQAKALEAAAAVIEWDERFLENEGVGGGAEWHILWSTYNNALKAIEDLKTSVRQPSSYPYYYKCKCGKVEVGMDVTIEDKFKCPVCDAPPRATLILTSEALEKTEKAVHESSQRAAEVLGVKR
jgi:hypothetical protein